MTRKTALAFGIGASLMLAAGTASAAGTCGAEVMALQEQLGHQDSANATIGATDSGVQQPVGGASIDSSTSSTSTDSNTVANNSGANATIGATDPGVQQPAPEANASAGASSSTGTTTDTNNGSSVTTADNTGANATIGATDPGVQQPDGGGSDAITENNASGSTTTLPNSGTVTETSRVGDLNTAAGGHIEAITALKKAQMAADAGDEGACMTELGTAKAALGIK
jgi:hypothetical protein